MSLKIYTYTDPYEIKRESYWNEIKDCAHFCVSQTMVNGLEEIYRSWKDEGYLTTMHILLNTLYSDWEDENLRVKQIMEVDNAINAISFEDDETGNARRSLEYNTRSLVKCIRLFKELGLSGDSFDVSRLNTDQKYLVEIYKYTCSREKTSFEFNRTASENMIDQKILEALKSPKSHKDLPYDKLDRSTVVIHGIHQFSPAMLCAIEDISKYKNVVLMFNYQEQYRAIYQTWLNIYSLFEKRIVFSKEAEFKPVSLMINSYPCNTLADNMGALANGELNIKSGILDKLEVIEFENNTEFAGYCAKLFETARKINPKSPVQSMKEQLYSASGKVNDILRAYFPEQFGVRHFLDYPIGHFFVAIVEMWDNENNIVKIEDMSLIKDCFESGIMKERAPGELLNMFNTIEPYIEKESTLEGIIRSLKRLRKYVNPTDKSHQRIGYLNMSKEKLDELRAALEELNKIVINFFSDFNSGGDNFNRFYRRIHDFIVKRTQDMESLDKEMKEVLSKLLVRMNKIDLPDTGTFTCLKQTMSFYLSQDDNMSRGANWIVRDFEQIDGDILRSGSGKQKADQTCYHFCCLSDRDICAAKDERLPWPLDINFFEYSYEPLEQNYQIFLKSKIEFKNFKRYALLYGLEFNRIGCKLSYVKNVDNKDNELYHLIKMLGLKVRKYHNDAVESYVPFLKYSVPTGISYPKNNEKVDKIKYAMCPYRFALESIVQEKTIYRERFLVIFYFRVMLQNAIKENNHNHNLNENELRKIINKEYQILDDKFHISNEYEKSQIISEMYKYLANKLREDGWFYKPSDNEKLKDDFLVVKLDDYIKTSYNIDLDRIINNDNEIYKNKRGAHCRFCSSKDICLQIAQK